MKKHLRNYRTCPFSSLFIVTALFLLCGTVAPQAQIEFSAFGVAVEENFNSMSPGVTIATLPANWRVDRFQRAESEEPFAERVLGTWQNAGTQTNRAGSADYGNNGGIVNFGDSENETDRAVGFYTTRNSTNSGNLYAWYINHTGAEMSALEIHYDIEKYRRGTTSVDYRIELYWSLDGEEWIAAGSSFYTLFPPDGAPGGGVDPAPSSVVAVSGVLNFAEPIAVGESFYLAWNYSVADGFSLPDQALAVPALAIDNVSVTAIPEPALMMSMMTGLLCFMIFRIRKHRL